MSSNSLFDFLHRTADRFSVSDAAVLIAVILSGLVLVLALGVVFHVALLSRGKRVSLRSALSRAGAVLWTLPVLAVMALFLARAFDVLREDARNAAGRSSAGAEQDTGGQATRPGAQTGALPFQTSDPVPPWAVWPADARSGAEPPCIVLTARGAHHAEAARRLTEQVRDLLERQYPGEFPPGVLRRVSSATIQSHVVEKQARQKGTETVGAYRNEAVQVYWLLDLSPRRRAALREAAVIPRVWILAGALLLLTVIVLGVAVYLRLDTATQGAYRGRLKLATTALIVAVGLLVSALVPMPGVF